MESGKGLGTPSFLTISCHARSFMTRVFRKPARVGKAASYLSPREKQTFAPTHPPWSSPGLYLFIYLLPAP